MKRIPAFLMAYSNSDFTNPHEVVLPDDPEECTGNFTHMGAKYWGLETGRHLATELGDRCFTYRHELCHWMRIGLKERGEIAAIAVSTKWFTGNQVRAISVVLVDEWSGEEREVLSRVTLEPDREHEFAIPPTLATEALISLYHEGGISRVSFMGTAAAEQLPQRENSLKKATVSHVSNAHYGHPGMAVEGERSERHMVGWESARTGFGEQAVFHLDRPTKIEEIVVDTYLHRLNAPLACHVFGCQAAADSLEEVLGSQPKWALQFPNGETIVPPDFQAYMLAEKFMEEPAYSGTFQIRLHLPEGSRWQEILPFAPLTADTYHRFKDFVHRGPFTHLLYMHYPNGGIHGLKVFGEEMEGEKGGKT